ncbi:YeeE/YedE thiosulfate transporter family protein [Methanocrinis sp.]|uniref:YeeE/YedE thiosulfate transporter family protein n=1 Tax=Methanocrinis sp. TaxID=3101522 RepID=UPI003D14B89E
MLENLRSNHRAQLVIGLLIGIVFGFLLQKGGVTRYEVIVGQLLLTDFTVFKVMASAVITGMIGVYLLRSLGLASLHPKSGSLGSSALGGLVFGAGFGLLGYCPGTIAGAAGQGSVDALVGGFCGVLLGAGLFAAIYPRLEEEVLRRGEFGDATFPEILGVNSWLVVVPAVLILFVFLLWIEEMGL